MINVIGLGYIGLPTALMFASKGIQVVGSDINQEIIKNLNCGKLNIDEVNMDDLFKKAIDNNIRFYDYYVSTDMYIVTVPTPYDPVSKKINNKYVIAAVKGILEVCKNNTIIVIESTISPGTIDTEIKPLVTELELQKSKRISIAHAPERIIPGNMIYELENNSRIIGADNIDVAEKIKVLYETFCKAPIYLTDLKTAEMTKVVENTYRDVNIAFANELALICNKANLDVYEVISLANQHPRVSILQPGPGVGGHCIPVDPWFLVSDFPHQSRVIKEARKRNDNMPEYVLRKITDIMEEHDIRFFTEVGIYGLSYKENVGDLRESPSLKLLDLIDSEMLGKVNIYDPLIKLNNPKYEELSLMEFIEKSKLIVIMVAHDELNLIQTKLKNKIIFDTKNVLRFETKYNL